MRKATVKRQPIHPDPKFNDIAVTSFVNNMMMNGKKGTAFRLFYHALEIVAEQSKQDGYELWKQALENVNPGVEIRSRRIGGATFQIPTEIRPERKESLGMKWLIRFARERKGKSMAERLAAEIMAASKNEGLAVKKREDTQRMAEANKAFSHFRV